MNDETTNLYIGEEFFVGVTPESFVELIRRFMGDEAADYYDWLLENRFRPRRKGAGKR